MQFLYLQYSVPVMAKGRSLHLNAVILRNFDANTAVLCGHFVYVCGVFVIVIFVRAVQTAFVLCEQQLSCRLSSLYLTLPLCHSLLFLPFTLFSLSPWQQLNMIVLGGSKER